MAPAPSSASPSPSSPTPAPGAFSDTRDDELDLESEDDVMGPPVEPHRPTIPAQGLAPMIASLGAAAMPQPAVSRTGPQPAVSRTGPQPVVSRTGPQPVVSRSGSEPVASRSGAQPAAGRTGTTGAQPIAARVDEERRETVSSAGGAARDTGRADDLHTTDPALKETNPGHAPANAKATRILSGDAPREVEARVRLVAGKVIPGTRYRLLRWLGEGGMGVVYEAEHVDIERRVAMKILRADLSQHADTAKVFRDEARAANRVGSRNIVQIHDFGELPDGRLFFCMELLVGVDLTTYKDQGMEPGELCGVLRQVCKGLGAAHSAGIVHRDIKPENILLVNEEGRGGLVKIVDFGVAAILGGDQAGPIAGTPHYMSPEQIIGAGFDGRLDQYAVGCMAYELLVSRPPFDGDSIESVLMGHLKEDVPPPSRARSDRAVPPALEAVILRCLAKDPDQRYDTMAELEAAICEAQIAAGLRSAWDDLPLPDVDPDRREWLAANMPGLFVDQRPKRPRWLLPAGIGLAVALSITGTALYMSRPPPPEMVSEVESLAQEAKDAAIATRWVVPAEGEAVSTTAYGKIRKLEGMGGEIADEADARAGELRKEFAASLDSIGDGLWAQGGQSFAATYYGWALVFDPDDAHARERVPLTEPELALIRKRADTGEFLDADRRSADIALAVVATDPGEKKALLASAFRGDDKGATIQRALFADAARSSGLVDGASLDQALDQAVGEPETPEVAATTGEPPEANDEVPVEPIPETPGKVGKTKKPKNEDAALEKAVQDPVKSTELADKGKSALTKGNRAEAETLFHQALSYDSRNTAALAGLSDIYFDRGAYRKAVGFAERAVKIASTDKSLRIKLGDGYFGDLRYNDALTQYEKAAELGESRAAARIAKVKAKLGGG
ncbi:MAG: protein kinase [Nannocystaceae bacterium]